MPVLVCASVLDCLAAGRIVHARNRASGRLGPPCWTWADALSSNDAMASDATRDVIPLVKQRKNIAQSAMDRSANLCQYSLPERS